MASVPRARVALAENYEFRISRYKFMSAKLKVSFI